MATILCPGCGVEIRADTPGCLACLMRDIEDRPGDGVMNREDFLRSRRLLRDAAYVVETDER